VKKLLEQGDDELSRGEFESAKEQFDKASALTEKHPAVLSALARLEAARADLHWLTLKATDPADTATAESEKAALQRRLVRVQKAADEAATLSPNDPAVLRARIDALRLEGDVSKARSLVGMLAADASQPETAYVLAALDMAEATPAWPSVVNRLRTAASAERGPGRARAALVYALAASGDIEQAKAELTKLEGGPSSQLLPALKAYIARQSAAAAPSASASASASEKAAAPAPSGAVPPPGPAASAGPAPRAPDFRRLLEDASAAKRSGDLGRAEALYRAAQEQHPGNIEATAGLGDVARARGDTATAVAYYETALRQSPTYLPALIASADIKWASGDKTGAVVLYKRVTNQAGPDSAYGQRAAQRIAEAQGGTHSTNPAPEKVELKEEESPPPAPAPKSPAETPPNIDTTDLPGFK
jgi:tetratricopeptide (TPR) repeat protein